MLSRFMALALLVALNAPAYTQVDDAPLAARLLGRSADSLRGARVKELRFEYVARTVYLVKAIDQETGEELGVVCDHAGRAVDLGAVRARDLQLRAENPAAKLTPRLAAAVEQAAEGDLLDVVAWLRFDPADLDRISQSVFASTDVAALSRAELDELEQQVGQAVIARNALTVSDAMSDVEGAVAHVRSSSATAPVIFVTATAAQVAVLAAMPAVDTLYLERTDGTDGNVDANESHRTRRVHELGVKGRGTRVAILENNGIEIGHPWLNVTAWFSTTQTNMTNPDEHVQGTSGCVASLHPGRPGAAPDVSLYSANAASYSDQNLTLAGDWIATTNIDITNMSFQFDTGGAEAYLDRYFNYQSRFFQDAYVACAGNFGTGSNQVSSPGQAYNCLTVGSFNEAGDGNWDNDTMSTFSSSIDPATGCEKPNIAANGDQVDTLGMSTNGWLHDDYSGCSFATPHTAGNLANAFVVNGTINASPEAANALIMASAWHNIEGNDRLSEEDGAGGLHGLAAFRAARDGRTASTTLQGTSFSTNGYYTYNIHLNAGDRTRVAIAWGASAGGPPNYTTTNLDADLDLAVYAGQNQTSGTFYGSSSSFNNNFEIVEFTPPTTGWYTVRINDFTFNGTSERVGIAWSRKYADTSYFALREFTSETSTTAGPTIGQSTYYMDFQAPNSPSAVYFCAAGGLNGPGTSYSAENWVPLSTDIWGLLWLNHVATNQWFWSGYIGTLNSSGTTLSNRMALPNIPPLIGTTVSHIGYTIAPGYPDNVKELSEVHTFKFWPTPTELTMGDDTSEEIQLPFTFNFYGNSYPSVFVNANGNLTFGSGDSDWSESATEMLADQPRIAALWDDLAPHQGGLVRVRNVAYGDRELVVEYVNLPQLSTSDANTARVILRDDGTIRLQFRDVDLVDALVGISPGNGVSSAAEVDLSGSGERLSSGALFERFTGSSDPFDLSSASTIYYSTIEFVPTSSSATSYRVKCNIAP